VPAFTQAQKPWVTKADAQNVLAIISGDNAPTRSDAAPYRPFTIEPTNWRAKSPAVIKLEKHHRT
jgi:hypothetical protein